jgi:putative nucleotidyltransferase with HDIG domain
MSDLAISRVVARVQQLPSLSAVVHEVLLSFDNENVDIPSLVTKISRDQGLAARVLRVANSAFYGLSAHVSSIGEAVVVLGFYSVRSLVVAAGVINQFPHDGGRNFDRLAFWRHAIGVGVCAKVIAARICQNPETAFTAGLLHDIGVLVLDAFFHPEFEQVLDYLKNSDGEVVAAESATLNLTHGAIGYEVAKRWNFPQAIQLAIRDHHQPDDGEPALYTDIVHLANVLCHALEIGNSCYDMAPPIAHGAWRRLGLDWADMGGVLREIEQLNACANLLVSET